MWRNIDRVAWLTLALIMLAPVGALAQSPGSGGPPLEARLPATIEGGPVEVVLQPRTCRPGWTRSTLASRIRRSMHSRLRSRHRACRSRMSRRER